MSEKVHQAGDVDTNSTTSVELTITGKMSSKRVSAG